MEMVLQQSLQRPGMMSGAGAGGCRPGPRPAAATAPMMAATAAKREPEPERETARDGDGGEEGGGGVGTDAELRRGPWTVEEDLTLINYIADHGEGRWNALARAAGLKRTGKSCRLRWLNYLRPDVKRGDFTADEQLLILDLHSRWGNRWSKIAAELPGRTDNEIKNYWRTRVQKHAKQLNCDVNSARFKDAMRFLWMPRLAERAAANSHRSPAPATTTAASSPYNQQQLETMMMSGGGGDCSPISSAVTTNTNSPSCSSSESAAAAPAAVVADEWAAAAMQQQGADHEYWSTASALQQLTATAGAGGDHHNNHQAAVLFHDMPPLQDLTGWVQGFSEAGVVSPDGLWSLDDMIWRMQ